MAVGTGSEEEMACIELVELVTAYFEDALSPVDRQRFEEHLAACGPCRNYMEQFRMTLNLAGRLAVEDLSQQDRAAFLEAFRDWRG
jgi:predicted anti-sigma-YlaC factor YlaD